MEPNEFRQRLEGAGVAIEDNSALAPRLQGAQSATMIGPHGVALGLVQAVASFLNVPDLKTTSDNKLDPGISNLPVPG
jgi:hypothetical protein